MVFLKAKGKNNEACTECWKNFTDSSQNPLLLSHTPFRCFQWPWRWLLQFSSSSLLLGSLQSSLVAKWSITSIIMTWYLILIVCSHLLDWSTFPVNLMVAFCVCCHTNMVYSPNHTFPSSPPLDESLWTVWELMRFIRPYMGVLWKPRLTVCLPLSHYTISMLDDYSSFFLLADHQQNIFT